MKLLIIEDGGKTGEYLTKGLTKAGPVVDLADNGLNSYHLAMAGDHNPIILDVTLPDVSDWDIVHILRSTSKGVSVLLLAALGTIGHRVEELELGADDYLARSFAFTELLARVRTLLRREAAAIIESQFQIADLMIDLVSRKVTRSGMCTVLASKGFTLLELSLHHQDKMLPCLLITSQAWGMNFDSDTSAIGVAVKRLHDEIDNNFEPKLVQVMHGVGYMLGVPDGQ